MNLLLKIFTICKVKHFYKFAIASYTSPPPDGGASPQGEALWSESLPLEGKVPKRSKADEVEK